MKCTRVSHYLPRVLYIPGSCLGFLPTVVRKFADVNSNLLLETFFWSDEAFTSLKFCKLHLVSPIRNVFQLRQWHHHAVLRTLSSMFLINWILSLTWYQLNPSPNILLDPRFCHHPKKNTQIDIQPVNPISLKKKKSVGSNSPPFPLPITSHQNNPHTLAPPKIAQTGRTGASNTCAKASNSSRTRETTLRIWYIKWMTRIGKKPRTIMVHKSIYI